MSTITIGATTITPDQVDGYESTRQGGNIMHPILGSSNADVTFRPAKLRTGTLRMVFGDSASAKQAEDAHATGQTAAFSAEDTTTIDMTYVVAGRIVRALDDATRDAWTVEIDFQEVSAP